MSDYRVSVGASGQVEFRARGGMPRDCKMRIRQVKSVRGGFDVWRARWVQCGIGKEAYGATAKEAYMNACFTSCVISSINA